MDSQFSLVEEERRNSLQQLVRTVDSAAFQGDAPRLRMKDELMQTLAQSKSVTTTAKGVHSAMDSLYEFIDEARSRDNVKRLRR